ncbi:MAG: 30S ribosomal protein S17 [Candidatus Latescibacterota bacterium]|nr:MAG: 30S ribosomal protein S17 [Candidatus Latescibacterota bacterium]
MERGKRKVLVGQVVSDKMDKTVVVEVTRTFRHPLYRHVVRRRSKFMAHDEGNVAKIGDLVEIMETRPLSRRKRWRVVRVISEQEKR